MPANLLRFLYTGGTWIISGQGEGGGGGPRTNPDLAFVVIDVLLLFVINFWQQMMVGKARKKFGVDYPNMYAIAGDGHKYKHAKGSEQESLTNFMGQDAADDYNSVQRAHQNTVENQPLFLSLLLFGSMGFPAIAAAIGMLWLLSRIAYSAGYYKAPGSRVVGAIVGFLSMFALFFLNVAFVVYLLIEKDAIEF